MLHSNLISIRASLYYCNVFYSLCKENYFDTVLMQSVAVATTFPVLFLISIYMTRYREH